MKYDFYAHMHSIQYTIYIVISFFACMHQRMPRNNLSCNDMFKRRRMTFQPPQPPAPNYFSKVKMSVSIKDFHSAKVAERVAMLMMQKIKSGSSEPSPMLVVRVVGWKSKVHSGRTFMPKLRGTCWFFEVEFSCPISLLLVSHRFLFPSCRLFLFPGGQKEPMPELKTKKGLRIWHNQLSSYTIIYIIRAANRHYIPNVRLIF